MVRVDDSARSLGVFVAFSEVKGVSNGYPEFEKEMVDAEKRCSSGDLEKLKDNPVVRAYRDFYWRIGIDPTKTRPAGEALRRRLMRGGKLPRINFIVDVGNVVSCETLVPIGIYDRAKFSEEPVIRLSRGGEVFYGIGKKEPEVLPKGVPIMVSGETVMHIYPHRDSVLTSVSEGTRDVLVVCAGVPGVEPSLVEGACSKVVTFLREYGRGEVISPVRLA